MTKKGEGIAVVEIGEGLDLSCRGVIFVGREGSGKSTVARRLAKESGLPYLSTGDILRDFAEHDEGELGDLCREMFAEHTYLEPMKLLEILEERLSREDVQGGFVLDGGLRTVPETEGFGGMLSRSGRAMAISVVHLNVPHDVCMDRLVTGENPRGRADDTVEAVRSRFNKYDYMLEERLALIEAVEGWELIHIDGTSGEEEVFVQVCERLLGGLEIPVE